MHLVTNSLDDVYNGCLSIDYDPKAFVFVIMPPESMDVFGGLEALIDLHHLSGDKVCIIAPYVCFQNELNITSSKRLSYVEKHFLDATQRLIAGDGMDFHKREYSEFIGRWQKENYDFLRKLRVPTSAMPCIIVTEKLDGESPVLYKTLRTGIRQEMRACSDLLWENCGWHDEAECERIEQELRRVAYSLHRLPSKEDIKPFKDHENLVNAKKVNEAHCDGNLKRAVHFLTFLKQALTDCCDHITSESTLNKMQDLFECISKARVNPTDVLHAHDFVMRLKRTRLKDELEIIEYNKLSLAYEPFNKACQKLKETCGKQSDFEHRLKQVEADLEEAWERYKSLEYPAMLERQVKKRDELILQKKDYQDRARLAEQPVKVLLRNSWLAVPSKEVVPNAPTSVVFVHGLGGHESGTWGGFPELIEEDKNLSVRAFFFSFTTKKLGISWFRRGPTTQTIAKQLKTYVETVVEPEGEVVIVAHSLGGLIARQYVVDMLDSKRSTKLPSLLLYAVPNNGADLARVISALSRSRQANQLRPDSDFLEFLNERWARNKVDTLIRVRYVHGTDDEVVTGLSAHFQPANDSADTVRATHLSIVKPSSHDDLSYKIFKKFVGLAVVKN